MIICPKCNANNQIGAIFCRGCGDKLDLDELKPEAIQKAARALNKRSVDVFGWVKNAILLILLLAVVVILIGLFMQPSLPSQEPNPSNTSTEMKAVRKQLDEFRDGQTNRLKIGFTEVPLYAAELLLFSAEELASAEKKDAEAGVMGMQPKACYVEVLEPGDNNRIRLTLRAQFSHWAAIRYYKVLEGKLQVGEGGITFEPQSVAMGRWPMNFSNYTKESVLKDFQKLLEGKAELQTLQKQIKRIEWKEGEVRCYRNLNADADEEPTPKKKKKKSSEPAE